MPRLDHLNARLGARRAALLGPDGLVALVARSGAEARLEALRQTPAGRGIPRELPPGPDGLARAETALREGVRLEAARLLAFAEGTRARALLGAFLDLDAARAAAAVLRGATHGAPPAATAAAAPPVPGLPEETVLAAAGAAGPEEAFAVLVAALPWLALAGPAPARGDPGALARAERDLASVALARAHRASIGPGEDGRLLGDHLADRADAENARALLALVGSAPAEATPAPAAGRRTLTRWLPGGRRLSPDWLDALRGATGSAARREVAAAFALPPAALATPWAADRALERALLRPLERAARARPLSIAVPLAYLLARREEARDAALVLRGTALGLPPDELLGLLDLERA